MEREGVKGQAMKEKIEGKEERKIRKKRVK